GSVVPRWRSAARCPGARIRRDGLGDRLGPLRRPDGRRGRHEHLRLLGAAQRAAYEVRLHAGEGVGGRKAADRKIQRAVEMMNIHHQTKESLNPLRRLHDFGQAVWLDFLARRFIAEGGLKRLIEQDALSGVTSNPSIFEKAIGGSSDYDV